MAIIQSLNLVFKAATKQAEGKINGLGGTLGKLGKKFGVTGALASAAASVMSVQWFNATADAIDQQAKFADRLGASFEALQNLQFSAGQAGVKTAALNVGIQRMTRRLGEVFVKGTGQAANTIEKLGLSMEALQKMSADEQFNAIGKEIGKVNNQSEKLALTFSLFDTEGAALVNLFDEMAQSGNDVATRLSKMGAVVSTFDADKVEAMNDAFAGFSSLVSYITKMVVVKLSTGLRNMTQDLTDFIAETKLLQGIERYFTPIAAALGAIATSMKILLNLGTIVWHQYRIGVYSILKPVTWLVEAMANLGKVVGLVSDETVAWAEGFSKGVTDEIKESFGNLVTDFKDIGDALGGSLFEEIDEKTKSIGGNIKGMKGDAKKVTFGQKFEAKLIDVAALSQNKLKSVQDRIYAETKKQTGYAKQTAENTAKPKTAVAGV